MFDVPGSSTGTVLIDENVMEGKYPPVYTERAADPDDASERVASAH